MYLSCKKFRYLAKKQPENSIDLLQISIKKSRDASQMLFQQWFYGKSSAKRSKRFPAKAARRYIKFWKPLMLNIKNNDQP
jgi:hypothetical protein